MVGSTRKRGKTWTADWSSTDPATGKRVQHSKGGFRTKAEAQRHLTTVVAAVQNGSWAPTPRMTVKQLLSDWMAASQARALRAGTLAMYQSVIDGWILPHLASVEIGKLTPAKAQAMVEELRKNGSRHGRGGLSDRSVQLAVQVLKAATRWAAETGIVARDPLQGFRRPRSNQSCATNAWTAPQARQFLASIEDDRLRAAWWLLLTRGLRRGELAGLRWSDIDLDAGFVRITATRVVVKGATLESTPKTSAGRRSIPLDHHLCAELKAHQETQLLEHDKAGDLWQPSGLVFVNEIGEPYRPERLSRRFTALAELAGVPPIRLHDLRHTAATLMLSAGESPKVVAEILGHSSPMITQNIYQHVLPGMTAEAGERLTGSLLGAEIAPATPDLE